MPLVGVAADEAVEVLEAQAARPQIEWTRLARHPVRHIVHFAEPGSVIAVSPEDLRNRTRAPGYQRVVARITRGHLSDHAACVGVVVASRNQRGTGRRAESRGMERIETESAVREPLKVGRLNRPAECAARAEANVIGQN